MAQIHVILDMTGKVRCGWPEGGRPKGIYVATLDTGDLSPDSKSGLNNAVQRIAKALLASLPPDLYSR